MERSWWWKAVLYGGLTLVACLYLVPSVVPDNKQPAFLKNHFQKKIQQGLDLQGGLHLVYSVDIEKAVSGKVDHLANEIEDATKKKVPDAEVTRDGRDDIVVKFKNPADVDKLDQTILRAHRAELDEVERNRTTGVVRLRLDSDQVADIEDSALRQGIETIRNRVDKFGVADPTIIKKGTDIVIELPGLKNQSDFDRVKNIIGRTAQLEFKIVDDDADDYMKKVIAKVPKEGQPGSGPITYDVYPWTTKDGSQRHDLIYLKSPKREDLEKFLATAATGDAALPPDREFGLEEVTRPQDGEAAPERYWRAILLKKRAQVTGEYLASADETWDEMGRPKVAFAMDRKGAELMGKLTGDNVGRLMAIVLDERVNSAPVIESKISDRGEINMGGTLDPMALQQEVKDLIAVLRSGALPAPLKRSFETQVGPTLGEDAIHKATFSMTIGALAVVLFMLIYYRLSGIIANLAMILNMLYMLAILAGFEASLTLPGIAGLVLTIGMAVDANIIIYERIREELRLGKSPRTAVDAGFSRAFWTVFDAHVTNFVAGVVLYSYGSGPIRGFAVTLLIGILTNLLTSVWISRWMFDLVVGRRGAMPATLSI
jgi:protein-export membrane protein SecD